MIITAFKFFIHCDFCKVQGVVERRLDANGIKDPVKTAVKHFQFTHTNNTLFTENNAY